MRLNLAGRQWALQIHERIDFTEFNAIADGTLGYITVPPGAYVQVAISAIVDTAFVGPTTPQLIATNDATAVAIATVDLTSAATTSLLAVGHQAEGFRIKLEVNKAGAVATAGVVRLVGAYVIDKRANETQTDVRPLT